VSLLPGPAYSWESQARQYAERGHPGIGYERHYADGRDVGPTNPVDCLLMRDQGGELLGILNHYPEDGYDHGFLIEHAGNVNLWVKPSCQRQGIGTALLAEAEKRWTIDYTQQRYSPSGLALLRSLQRKGRA